MAISDRITSIEEHIKESYQELEGLGIDTTGVNNNLENIPKLIDGYWETLPKVTGEGTSITLDNTKEGKMKIVLKGNTSQEGTPTPEAPQDIHVVSGDNSIVVCGKNLFDIDSSLDGKYYESDGTIHTATNAFGELIPISSTSVSYNIKNNSTTNVRDYLFIFDENMNRISGPRWGSTVNAGATVTLESLSTTNAKYITISVLGLSPSSKEQIEIQIEKGTTATTYEAYTGESYPISLGDIELCKIGNYQDYLYKDNGSWYLHKEVRHLSLTISDMDNNDNYPGWNNQTQLKQDYPSANNSFGTYTQYVCNIGVASGSSYATNPCLINTNTSGLLMLGTGYFHLTQTQWKEQYPNLVVELYYGLQTPYDEEITNTTLISQLDALETAMSYTGQTNISQESNDLASILNATALKEM